METDDFFAKMMFNSINTEEYYQNNEDTPSTSSDYGADSFHTDLSQQPSHHKTSSNLTSAVLKLEAVNKLNQIILPVTEIISAVKFPTDEVRRS